MTLKTHGYTLLPMPRVKQYKRDSVIFETKTVSGAGWRTIAKVFKLSHMAIKKAYLRENKRRELSTYKAIDFRK